MPPDFPSAATSSTPTRSRSAAPSPAAAPSTDRRAQPASRRATVRRGPRRNQWKRTPPALGTACPRRIGWELVARERSSMRIPNRRRQDT
ncbi:hypothetical protein ACFPRL_12450 [Pseudoclavibacter helvolus]